MTDDNLNRAVARIIDETHGAPATNEPRNVPAYCTDPAAWGALLVWVKEQGRVPAIAAFYDRDEYLATINVSPDWACFDGVATTPGRALVLAALRAWGVEVEDD